MTDYGQEHEIPKDIAVKLYSVVLAVHEMHNEERFTNGDICIFGCDGTWHDDDWGEAVYSHTDQCPFSLADALAAWIELIAN